MSHAVLKLRRCGLKRAKLRSRIVVMVLHCTLTQVNIYPNCKPAFRGYTVFCLHYSIMAVIILMCIEFGNHVFMYVHVRIG